MYAVGRRFFSFLVFLLLVSLTLMGCGQVEEAVTTTTISTTTISTTITSTTITASSTSSTSSTSSSTSSSTTTTTTTTSGAATTTTTTTITSTTSTIPRITGTVSGMVSTDTYWYGDILINGSVTVNSGATLYIDPGTVVKFKHYRGYKEQSARLSLQVYGGLMAEGNADHPIYFTSDAASPQNGDWSMVRLYDSALPCSVSHTVFEFAQHGLNVWNTDLRIDHSVFRFNNWEGIYFESYCQPTLTACQIYQNGYNGLACEQFNNLLLISCEVWDNGTNGIHVDASTLEIRSSLVHDNHAGGLSVDDNGTIKAYGVLSQNNRSEGLGVGEGNNVIEISNLTLSGNGNNSISGYYTEITTSYHYPVAINLGYTPDQANALDYTPGDQVKDLYQYVYPDEDETRRIVRKIGTGLGLTWSLAWDGQSIWTTTVGGAIYKLNPVTGSEEAHFTAPGSQPWGMTYDGEKLWIVDFAEKTISKVNPSTGSTEATYATPDPLAGCKGAAWDGQYVCVKGWANSYIYRMNRDGTLHDTITLDYGGGGGLAWDGNYFWVPSTNIIKYTATGQALGYIYPASEGTWDLAWDGTYLWATQRTNENWNDAKIFALEILSLKTSY